MKRIQSFLIVTMVAALSVLAPAALVAQDARQTVGLVLSGGGAKGIAHIGVIQALEDNDIPIDYITGTSMGTIVGALYAMGYTPDEMMQLILSPGFASWSTGKISPSLSYYFAKEEPSPALFSLPLGKKSAVAGDSVPASLISPLPMNFAFMELFSAYTAACGGDFNRLFVPFRCVASNMTKKQRHVFSGGSLGDAVRSSMSFPIVFQPVNIDGDLYYDGGIYDNFPVDVMRRDFAPGIMIGVDVSTKEVGPQTTLMDQIENLVIQGGSYELPADEGIKIRLDLNRFGLLDFPAARAIYKVGYDRTIELIDSIKGRVTSRTAPEVRNLRRRVFKSQIPYLRFGSTEVYGASPRQNEYIQYLFRPKSHSDTIGIPQAREAYYRSLSGGNIKDLHPRAVYNDSTGLFDLRLKATMKGPFKGSIGGYITSSSSSFLYLGADYSTMSFRSINCGIRAWLGQSNMAAMVDGRLYLHTPIPSAIGVEAVVSRSKYYESDRMFFDIRQPTFVVQYDYFGRLKLSLATGRHGKVDIGAGFGALRSSFYAANRLESYEEGKLYSRYRLGQVFARFTSSTLDAQNFPTSGYDYNICAMGLTGINNTLITHEVNVKTVPTWAQLEICTRNYPSLGAHFALGVETDILLSTRKLLPSYSASICNAPGFAPTPAASNAFRPAFHANSFAAAGLVPVWKVNSSLSARIGAYAFMPMREIRLDPTRPRWPKYGKWFARAEAFCEADITYALPFGAAITGYANYSTSPGDHWNVGLSLGIHILPPRFLR